MAFTGFPKDFFVFFEDLKANNNRDWFADNKPRYETCVAEPCLGFIEALGPHLQDISPHFLAVPKKVGGSMFRIYRDTRFSKDKTPYKTHAGLQFRHVLGKDAHAPGFYLHLDPNDIFMGGGLWKPPTPSLAKIRARIDEKPKEWQAALTSDGFVARYETLEEGDPLKRPPRGFSDDHPLLPDLKKRSFFMIRKATPKQAMRADFVDHVAHAYADAAPVMEFLCKAVDANF
ncbi:MAG: TIGR02453 family protein [Robiginitomaculum sp.]|nr:MAG: TIGR02453 family protein [Robiginitomaculum sp.]